MVSEQPPVESPTAASVKNVKLDGLFGHLCSSTGLYSRETFLSLYGCITRMIRDHHMTGFVMTRTLGDEAFETMTYAMESMPDLPLFRMDGAFALPSNTGLCEETGFLIVLTNRMCASLFWSRATHDTFRMYEGGWTFHPGDTRTIATQLINKLSRPELEELLQNTPMDRRYDDKLNVLLTALVNGLENRNRELTVALDQNKLLNQRVVNSERMAAVGQLSSVIAHEIRNPLGLIDLYAKLTEDQFAKIEMADTKLQETLLKNLSLIRQATSGLETILSELTNYAKPLQLNMQRIDVVEMVRDVCEFYRPSYEQKNIQLKWPSEDALGLVMIDLDVDKIRQALINLLKNALEASTEGMAVTVSITSRQNDPQIYIQVADEGKGVDEKNIKKLFTPYFSTKGNGTGLGLAHSRKILEAHGGSVDLVTTAPNKGSTFALILPKVSKNASGKPGAAGGHELDNGLLQPAASQFG